MALTKVGKEGIIGIDNSADATAITISSAEKVTLGQQIAAKAPAFRATMSSSQTFSNTTFFIF